VPIIPPMAAVANAIADATGIRLRDLPMSPPRLRAALDEAAPMRAAAEWLTAPHPPAGAGWGEGLTEGEVS
jgi:hypothetical protein